MQHLTINIQWKFENRGEENTHKSPKQWDNKIVGDDVDRCGGAEPPARGEQHGLATDRGGRQEAGRSATGR
jgi:hypothetical protein